MGEFHKIGHVYLGKDRTFLFWVDILHWNL